MPKTSCITLNIPPAPPRETGSGTSRPMNGGRPVVNASFFLGLFLIRICPQLNHPMRVVTIQIAAM